MRKRFPGFGLEPLPYGRGSETAALIPQGLLSRARKQAGLFRKTFTIPVAFALAFSSHIAAQPPPEISLTGGAMQHWQLHLQKDDYLHAVFLQKGIHVAITVLGP